MRSALTGRNDCVDHEKNLFLPNLMRQPTPIGDVGINVTGTYNMKNRETTNTDKGRHWQPLPKHIDGQRYQ